MNYTEKIEEILARKGIKWMPKAEKELLPELIEQLSALIKEAREEAVRGFGKWIFECPLHEDAEDDWVDDYLKEQDE